MIDRLYELLVDHNVPWWAAALLIFPLAMLAPAFTIIKQIVWRRRTEAIAEEVVQDRKALTQDQRTVILALQETARITLLVATEAKQAATDCEKRHDECEDRIADLEIRINVSRAKLGFAPLDEAVSHG